MTRDFAPLSFACGVLVCAIVAGCAAPGEPVARHPVVPAAIADLGARQYGSGFELTFTLPTKSVDRDALPEHPAIEIYRAILGPGAVPDRKTVWRLAYTIPSEQVDRYLRGERIEFRDTLTPDQFAQAPASSVAYEVRTSVVKTREARDSNVVVARIYPPPETPRDVRVEVTESALVLSWTATPVPAGAVSGAYHIYRGVLEPGAENSRQDVSEAKLKSPLELVGTSDSSGFRDPHFEFGVAYLYTVRAVAQFGAESVESTDSVPVAVTPRDTFPPSAPTGLEATIIPATPQAASYVELSWAISPETDLAGYSVYRSDAEDSTGERLGTEILPSPTFRDMSVQPGRRYFYRVTALDRAGNESAKSAVAVADVP